LLRAHPLPPRGRWASGACERPARARAGGREDREALGPSRADESRSWGADRKPYEPAGGGGGGSGGGGGGGGFRSDDHDRDRDADRDLGPSRADTEDRWGAKKFTPSEPPARGGGGSFGGGGGGGGGGGFEDRWGGPRRGGFEGGDRDAPRSGSPTGGGAPAGGRPRLNLAKRTLPTPELKARRPPTSFEGAPPALLLCLQRDGAGAERRSRGLRCMHPSAGGLGVRVTKDDRKGGDWGGRAAGQVAEASAAPRSTASSESAEPAPEPEPAGPPKPKANPFGAARPREEVLREQGRDWRKEEAQRRTIDRCGSRCPVAVPPARADFARTQSGERARVCVTLAAEEPLAAKLG